MDEVSHQLGSFNARLKPTSEFGLNRVEFISIFAGNNEFGQAHLLNIGAAFQGGASAPMAAGHAPRFW
jgi:hypothetical protein